MAETPRPVERTTRGREPHKLWQQAHDEFPRDRHRRALRYRELMVEAGNIIPGKPQPLPCGWTGRIDDLLDSGQREELNRDLAKMARQRRQAEAASRDIPLP